MKRIKILTFCLINFIVSYSFTQQLSYTCTSREKCEYNDITKTFDKNCEKISESSSFTVNEQETVISLVSLKYQFFFYVNEKSYDEENDIYIYDTYDENGNWFMMYFDISKMEIRLLDLSFPPVDKCYTTFKVKALF